MVPKRCQEKINARIKRNRTTRKWSELAAGDLAGAVWHLYLHRSQQSRHSRLRMRWRPWCRRIPHRISRFTAAGVVEFPADADGALDSLAAGASRNKNSII